LVGINSYQHFEQLTTPSRDVDRMFALLTSSIDPEYNWTQVATLPSKSCSDPEHCAVSTADLMSALGILFSDHGTVDDLLFYFAGHGVSRDGIGILATSDTTEDANGVPMPDLLRLIRGVVSSAKSVTIVLDCCGAGMMHDVATATTLPRNTSILTAAFAAQNSYERRSNESVFSGALCDGLAGGAVFGTYGRVTVTSLATYVQEKMAEEDRGEQDQQPIFHALLADIPIVRVTAKLLDQADVERLVNHFPAPDSEVTMTYAHEGPDKRGKARDDKLADALKDEFWTEPMKEFDYFKKLQTAGLLAIKGGITSLFIACGYDSERQKTEEFHAVYLTDFGKALWKVADKAKKAREPMKARSARTVGTNG
jgi:hypothetical protein